RGPGASRGGPTGAGSAATAPAAARGKPAPQVVENRAQIHRPNLVGITELSQRGAVDLKGRGNTRHHRAQRLHVGLDMFLPRPGVGHRDHKPAPARSRRHAAFDAHYRHHLAMDIPTPLPAVIEGRKTPRPLETPAV